MPGITSHADLLTAFAELEPGDEATRVTIASMLHLKRSMAAPLPEAPVASRESPWPERTPARLISGTVSSSALHPAAAKSASMELTRQPRAQASEPTSHEGPAPARGKVLTAVLERIRGAGSVGVRPGWLAMTHLLPPRRPRSGVPLSEPLFPPKQQRGILVAALATRSPDGLLDTTSVISALTEAKPLVRLPRLPTPTLRRGVQVLVDVAVAMDPYAADARSLVDAISEVVGRYRIQVFTFHHTPTLGVFALTGDAPLPWRPPPAATPVVIVSDLGIGGPFVNPERSRTREWLHLARRARAARCPIVALVPFPPHRWDPTLARSIVCLQWDRGTTAGAVRRKIGPGHGPR
ncbi:MAG TPA: hypothetical protein VEX86_05445 [Longimicrobium sp.]|nr:hypothetical protein [Longimicrobium sp.]